MEGHEQRGKGRTDREINLDRTTTFPLKCKQMLSSHGRNSRAQFLAISCRHTLSIACCAQAHCIDPPHVSLDCMLNGVGMLSSQRINLTTLSMSVRQTTHAPTAVELPLLLSDDGVRV